MLTLLYFERLTQRRTGLPFVVEMLTNFVSHCDGNIRPGHFVLRSTSVSDRVVVMHMGRVVGKSED